MPLDASPPRLTELKLTDGEFSLSFLYSYLDTTSQRLLHLKLFVGRDVFVGSFDLSSAASFHDPEDAPEGESDASGKETLKALRENHDSQYLFKLDRKNDQGSQDATLTWSCEVDGTSLLIGAASLRHQTENNAASELSAVFTLATSSIDAAKEENLRLEKENKRLESDRRNILEKSRKSVDEEKVKEDELIRKFVVILNEKKAEIRRLKRRLDGASGQDEEEDEGEDTFDRKSHDAGSSGDYEGDTDVDFDGDLANKSSERMQSSSRKGSPLNLDKSPPSARNAPPPAKKSREEASCSNEGGMGESKAPKHFSFARTFLGDSSDDDD